MSRTVTIKQWALVDKNGDVNLFRSSMTGAETRDLKKQWDFSWREWAPFTAKRVTITYTADK